MKQSASKTMLKLAAKRKAIATRVATVGFVAAASVLPALAQTNSQQTYGLGQGGSPAATDYTGAAMGFNTSLSPLLTAILPTLVVILAIFQGPRVLKKLVTMMAH